MRKYNSSLKPYIVWLIEHKLDFILWPFWFILIFPVFIIFSIPAIIAEAFKEIQNFCRERESLIKEIKKAKENAK